MVETKIFTQIISNIIESAKQAGLGSYAVRIANGVDGLTVSPDGGITITGNAAQILGDLIREYEQAMRAKLSTEVEVYPKSCTYLVCVYCAPRDNDLRYSIPLVLLLSIR